MSDSKVSPVLRFHPNRRQALFFADRGLSHGWIVQKENLPQRIVSFGDSYSSHPEFQFQNPPPARNPVKRDVPQKPKALPVVVPLIDPYLPPEATALPSSLLPQEELPEIRTP